MTTILYDTELMENQKIGSTLPAPENFEAIQNANNHPLFFFIDSGSNLTLCAEKGNLDTGWFAEILSTDLSSLNDGKTITAKTFDVTQNYTNGEISIAVAVSVEGEDNDKLYLITGLSNAADAPWMTSSSHRTWQYLTYDGPALSGNLIIANVYMKASMESHIVCELRNETTNALSNYKINSTGNPNWTAIVGAGNFTTLLGQVIGKPSSASHPGLYQLTQNASQVTSLQFLPMNSSDSAISLTPPVGASRIATLADAAGNTNLYVSATNSVYLFSPSDQTANASGTKILDHALISGVQDFHCHQNDTHTIIWALNHIGQVFYSKCLKGNEGEPNSWSVPIPLVTEAQRLATYFTDTNLQSIIFVHKEGDELIQYTQDPETTFWHERSILVPSTQASDFLQLQTFTTHLHACDSNNLPLANEKLTIKSSSPCSVYINNHFQFLSPDIAISLPCDAAGNMTIIQQTKSIGAVCYTVGLESDANYSVTINPMTKMLATMKPITTGAELGAVQITSSQGVTSNLVGPSISSASKDATANAIQRFVELAGSLPQDGSINNSVVRVNEILDEPFVAKGFDPSRDKIWAISFEKEDAQYWEDEQALSQFHMKLNDSGTISLLEGDLGGVWSWIKSTAGDVYQYAKHAVTHVTKILVSHVAGVIKVFIHIGESIYRFVANCVSDVLHATEVIFKKIAVTFEKLVEWLGFVFQWNDIIRTHNVTKNIVKRYIESLPERIDGFSSDLTDSFNKLEEEVSTWAGLESKPSWHTDFGGQDKALQHISKNTTPLAGQHSPQSNYTLHHLSAGLGKAVPSVTGSFTAVSGMQTLFNSLKTSVEAEETTISTAVTQLETQVFDQIGSLSFGDIIKRFTAIIVNFLTENVKNILVSGLNLLKMIIDGLINILDSAIEFPVLSSLYHGITGNNLSILDLACLVVSIPSTIIMKIAVNEAPFANDTATNDIISATTWADVKTAIDAMLKPKLPVGVLDGPDKRTKTPSQGTELSTAENRTLMWLYITAGMGAFGLGTCVVLTADPDSQPFGPLDIVKGVFFFMATTPAFVAGIILKPEENWLVVMAQTIYGITAIQKIADAAIGSVSRVPKWLKDGWKPVTKGLDCVLGLCSLVPALGIPISKGGGAKLIIGGIGATGWSMNRILNPFADINKTPRLFALRVSGIIVFYGFPAFILAEIYGSAMRKG
ncbi:hypothetical protein HED22_01015 [Thalassospira sp. HF15]|uniref:hypothetical protein n=1 Tax=Thalassospira sp. HF15 TaxID=2722755 RepID=UPI0014301A9B|nr:hypothetical protein [Thalassospira sp. HF15]NIY74214.1 hypothetical protein [Thalassospira sp. HF15]